MSFVLIIHEVKDFTIWKSGFDKTSNIRKESGELEYHVLTYENDANKVVHYSKWDNHEQAKVFFEPEKVIQIRKDLGIKQPDSFYLNEIKQGARDI